MKECKNFGTERCFWQEKCTHLPGSWTLKDGGRRDLIMEENLKLGNQVKMVGRQENREESCETVSTAGC